MLATARSLAPCAIAGTFVLLAACAHPAVIQPPAAPEAPLTPPPPPLPADASNALAKCVENGFWCLGAALLAPVASLQKACLDEVPGACVASTVAQLERPAVDGEWNALVGDLDRWCAIGDRPACGVLALYRSDRGPAFLTGDHVAAFRYVRPDYARVFDASAAAETGRMTACRAGDLLACDPHPFNEGVAGPDSDFEVHAEDACEAGDLEACVHHHLLRLLMKKRGADVEGARRNACEAGLAWHCVGTGDPAIVSKTKQFQAICASGDSAAACLPGDFEDDDRVNCGGLHRACEVFACPKPLVDRLLSCQRRLAPWSESDRLLARVRLASDELDCREGTAEACVRAASAHQSGVPGIAADPVAAHTYGQLACRVHGDRASCAIPAPASRPTTTPARRLLVTPLATGQVTLAPETIRDVLARVDVALSESAQRASFERIAPAEVLAARAFDPRLPCDAACVRTLDRKLHPTGVLVPFALAQGDHAAIGFRHFTLDPPQPMRVFGADGPTHEALLADLDKELEQDFARRPPGYVPDGPRKIPADAPLHDAVVAYEVIPTIQSALDHVRSLDPRDERTSFWNQHVSRRILIGRGNRFALFFDPSRPLQDRSHRFDDTSDEIGGIAADTFAFPAAATPTAVVATRCPVTEGPVGHRGDSEKKGNASAHDWLVLAAANLDADDTLECWTLASFDRTTANGLVIRADTPFQEQADVEPARVRLVEKALRMVGEVAAGAAIMAFPTHRLPGSLDEVVAFATRVGKPIDPVRTCEGFRYERLADDRLRVRCEGLRQEREFRVEWREEAITLVPQGEGRSERFPRKLVDFVLHQLEMPRGDGTGTRPDGTR